MRMLVNMSADATNCFQLFQPSSELFEKIEKSNRPKKDFVNGTRRILINPPTKKPVEHSLKDNWEMAKLKLTCILVSHEHWANKKSE